MSKTKSDSLSKNALAGGTAGAIEVCIMYPTEYVKTQLQLNPGKYNGPIKCATTIVQERGVFGLYRGLSTLIVGSIPKAAVRFSAFQEMSKRLKDDRGKLTTANTVLCGLVAGASEAIIAVAPAETLKTKMVTIFAL
jgi:solute carrier family 25 citrate transporter 1